MTCPHCGAEIYGHSKYCPKCGASVATKPKKLTFPHDLSGVWPEWELEKQLGKGSFGTVYQAVRRDIGVEARSAIKIISIPMDEAELDDLRYEGLSDEESKTYIKGIVQDFIDEIRLMESLKGMQNIVSVEDFKVVEKAEKIGYTIYIRMELLTPFNAFSCDKALTEREIVKLGCDICSALEICAKRNIIHRDVKPENIFINDFGYYKLGDFGIARKLENMTGGLSQKGTFNYMAPEVAASADYDARADLYSLGIVLYRLLNNNKLPFLNTEKQLLSPAERKNATHRRLRGDALPAPCNASPALAAVILRACEYDPNKRFATATAMKQALQGALDGVMPTPPPAPKPTPKPAPKPTPTPDPPPKKGAGILLGALLAVAGILCVVLIVALVNMGNKSEPEPDPIVTTMTAKETQEQTTTTVRTTTTSTTDPTGDVAQTTTGTQSTRAGAVDPTYLIPESNVRYLSQEEVDVLSTEVLIYAINEVYARHGYIFKDDDFGDYFMTKTWYNPTLPSSEFRVSMFNEYEQYNVDLLKKERKTRG